MGQTKIRNNSIADGAINNIKIADDASIDTYKLKEGDLFLKKSIEIGLVRSDGTVDNSTYLTNFSEIDPTVPNYAKSLTGFDAIKSNTDLLYQPIGDYLMSESDPTVPSYSKSLTSFNIIKSETDNIYKSISYVPNWVEITEVPSTFTPSPHTHSITDISETSDLQAIESLSGTNGLLRKTAANTWVLDTATYLTSYTETDPTVGSHIKSITVENITNWNSKQSQLISGTNVKTINGQSLLGSGDIGTGMSYQELVRINNILL